MSLLRLNNLTKLLSQRHLIPCVQSSYHVRNFADATNGRKKPENHGMVNKNRDKKIVKEQPNLTIYPFGLNDLKNPALLIKTTNKNESKKASKIQNDSSIKDLKQPKSQPSNSNKSENIIKTSVASNITDGFKKPQSITKLTNIVENVADVQIKNSVAQSEKFDKISTEVQKKPENIILSKNVINAPNVHQNQSQLSDPWPIIVRQIRSSSKQMQAAGGSQPTPPPNKSNNQAIWMGIAAILLGGGAYYIYNSKDDKSSDSQDAFHTTQPKKQKIPATPLEIPKEVPYLLIGGGTASFAAFRAIKSHDPKARIMVLSSEVETPYMRPPLSKELWLADEHTNGNGAKSKAKNGNGSSDSESLKFKQWNGVERSLYYEPNDFYIHPSKLLEEPNGGVAIVRGYTVKKVDVENRKAILTDGTEIKYGECLIATGSVPKKLPVFENASPKLKERISLFKTIDDYGSLKKYVDRSKSVAIVGGGFLGSELACALAKYGENKKLQVHQVFHEPGNMGKILPQFLSEWTTERVREEGVNVIPNTEVKSVDLVDNQVLLTTLDGKTILCDHVVVAVGSEPNVELAQESGLEVDTIHGGYLVNAELAARNHLYVAGDAACFYDPRLGRRRVEHHDHAVVSGRLAGENMVGKHKPYTHQSMFWSDLGPKIGYEALGIIDSNLPTVSVFVKKPSETSKSDSSGVTPTVQAAEAGALEDDYSKGVVFYMKDEKIVGIVLWNVFNRINTARAVISQDKQFDDLNEVAKLFDIHT